LKQVFIFIVHALVITWLYIRVFSSYLWMLYSTKVLEMEYPYEKLIKKHQRNAKRYKIVATSFRGGLIKLAQFISTQKELIHPIIIKELEVLQDRVEPISYEHIRKLFFNEVGKYPEDVFDEFEKISVASASFGQVHRARLKTGETVAVKIQYDNMDKILAIDMTMAGHFVKVLSKILKRPQLIDMYQEIKDALFMELNYIKEADFAEIFRENFKNNPEINAPKIYRKYTSEKVLVSDFIDGYRITDIEKMKEFNLSPVNILEKLMDSYFQQFYFDGFFHSDPHPGNIFFLKNGSLSFIDFGQAKKLDDKMKISLREAVVGVLTYDTEKIVDSFYKMEIIDEDSIGKLKYLVDEVLNRAPTGSAAEIRDMAMDFDFIKNKLIAITREMNIKFPSGIVLYGRTIAYLNGLIGSLAPDDDMFEMARISFMKRL